MASVTPNYLAPEGCNCEHKHQSALFCALNGIQYMGLHKALNWIGLERLGMSILLLDELNNRIPEPVIANLDSIVFANPNGADYSGGIKGNRQAAIQGARMKAEGLRSGVLDITVAYKGVMFLELKRPSLRNEDKPLNGTSKDQVKFFYAQLQISGNECRIAYDWQTALKIILRYLARL